MAIDQTKIGLAAANLMQQLEEAYGDDAEIETVMVIAAVDHGMQNTIHFGASPGTPATSVAGCSCRCRTGSPDVNSTPRSSRRAPGANLPEVDVIDRQPALGEVAPGIHPRIGDTIPLPFDEFTDNGRGL